MSIYRTLKGYNIKSVTSDPANTKEGQIWYNDTLNKLKVNTVKPAAWASGGNLGTARERLGAAGTQTAGLAFGGNTGTPPSPTLSNTSEEYNGSSWTEGNNLNTARMAIKGAGSQTAAVGFGGGYPVSNGKCRNFNSRFGFWRFFTSYRKNRRI